VFDVRGIVVAALELRVPPIVLGPFAALLMWPTSVITPHVPIPVWVRITIAVALSVPAVLLVVLAYAAFGREHVAKDSKHPEQTKSLVTTGVFAHTRNPMYLSLLLVLLALAIVLSSPVALILVAGFVLYVHRFQVVPEERALHDTFGSEYDEYLSRVRRWA
jgi:protein-S-isoprenylcysteine O-methyltransferase Ste14